MGQSSCCLPQLQLPADSAASLQEPALLPPWDHPGTHPEGPGPMKRFTCWLSDLSLLSAAAGPQLVSWTRTWLSTSWWRTWSPFTQVTRLCSWAESGRLTACGVSNERLHGSLQPCTSLHTSSTLSFSWTASWTATAASWPLSFLKSAPGTTPPSWTPSGPTRRWVVVPGHPFLCWCWSWSNLRNSFCWCLNLVLKRRKQNYFISWTSSSQIWLFRCWVIWETSSL